MRAFLTIALLLVCLLALGGCSPAAAPAATAGEPPIPPTIMPSPSLPPALPATQGLPTAEPSPMAAADAELPQPMDIVVTVDQAYAGERLLDVYAPAAGSGWPVVVVLHGGNADKRGVSSLAEAVAGQGAVVFVPTFSSSFSPVTIAQGGVGLGVEEASCAVRFARARAAEYGGDPQRVVAAGHSAGGAFAVVLALAGDEFHGGCVVSEGSGSVDGVVGLDGAYDLVRYTEAWILKKAPAESWRLISPHAWIERQPLRPGVGFRLFAGLETGLVQEGQALRDALLAAGYPVDFDQLPGIDHLEMGGARPQTILAILELARGS